MKKLIMVLALIGLVELCISYPGAANDALVTSAAAATPADSGGSDFQWAKVLIYSYYGGGMQTAPSEIAASIARAEQKGFAPSKIWAIRAEAALRDYQYANSDDRVKASARTFAYRALASNPREAAAFAVLARLDLIDGCVPCARLWADRAIKADARDPDAAFSAALSYLAAGDPTNARTFLDGALQNAGSAARSADLQLHYSLLLAKAGDLDAAEASFRKTIQIAGTSRVRPRCALEFARFLLYERGDPDGAIREIGSRQEFPVPRPTLVILEMSAYVKWAREVMAPKATGPDKTALKPPGTTVSERMAFLDGASHFATSEITLALLKTRLITDVNTRDSNSNTALIAAARSDNISLIRNLVARNASVDAQNSRSERALLFAAGHGNLEATRLLVDKKAQVNFTDADGNNPLSTAIRKGHEKVAVFLVRNKAKLDISRDQGGTLMIAAASHGSLKLLQVLVGHGADINALDAYGLSALTAATLFGHRDVVRWLLKNKADSNLRFLGLTAMDYAREKGDSQLIEIISAGAGRSI